MNPRIVYALCVFLVVGSAVAKTDEYGNEFPSVREQFDEKPDRELAALNDEKPQMVVEDYNTETSALVQQDETDSDTIKNKGFCHWGIGAWFKPGYQTKCNCLKCTCKAAGKWDCAYHFAYCPYFYCGNVIYNPNDQVCCCGKVYDKKTNWSCCGYYYYSTHTSKCCNYYSVKPKKMNCPRYEV